METQVIQSKYRKLTSRQRNEESKTLLSNLYSLKMFNEKIKKRLKEGNYTIEQLVSDLNYEITDIESTVQEIDEVEKYRFKLFYPDPCNENECAMCGREYKDHFHHHPQNQSRPFCNNF